MMSAAEDRSQNDGEMEANRSQTDGEMTTNRSQNDGEVEENNNNNEPQPSETDAQEKLAELASSLMMAAQADQFQMDDGEVEEIRNDNDAETIPMKPLVRKARKLLFRRLRVGVEDSRVFVGKFHCLDKQGNLILYDTVEYRQISPSPSPPPSTGDDGGRSSGGSGVVDVDEGATTEQRSLGLVLIPARCRTSCHVECSLHEQFSLLSV
ncbi:unnamed protein product [Calypogeia fissa]